MVAICDIDNVYTTALDEGMPTTRVYTIDDRPNNIFIFYFFLVRDYYLLPISLLITKTPMDNNKWIVHFVLIIRE
jgi:hypothetical protein